MIEVKSGNLSLNLLSFAKAPSAQISVGFSIEGLNWFVLNKLIRGDPCSCPSLAYGSEVTSLCFSIFKMVEFQLISNPKLQNASKVSRVNCNAQNGMFFITIETQNNGSAMRKVLSVVMKSLVPERMFKIFSGNIRLLNGTPDRSHFNYVVNMVRESLKDVTVLVIGKFPPTLDKEKVKEFADSIQNKFNSEFKKLGDAKKPESMDIEMGVTEFPTLTSKGINAVFIAQFLRFMHPEIRIDVHSDEIIIRNLRWKANDSAMEKSAKLYCSKFANVNDLKMVCIYGVVCKVECDPQTIIKFAEKDGNKFTSNDYLSALKQWK